MALPTVFVTGGNAGIGAAICKQLVLDQECKVFMGSRSTERGQAAIKDMRLGDKEANIFVVQCDVQADDSVQDAAAKVREALGNQQLYGLVNNAGTGFEHKVSDKDIIDTNFYGPKRVCDNFIKLLDPTAGRIVNIGSNGGPEFVSTITDLTVKKQMCSASTSWAELEVLMERFLGGDDFGGGTCYDLSKAGLMVYTMQLAAQYPNLKVSCVNPGFISTNMSKGYGATKLPDEGTLSTMKCLFEELPGNGFFYECDGLRSPLNKLRKLDEPEYDGKPPVFD